MSAWDVALERLRTVLSRMQSQEDFRRKTGERDEVLARYQPVFDPHNLDSLSEEVFRSFLYFENNKHWTGLQRTANLITSDMDALRKGLAILLDESRPLAERFDEALKRVKGMGKALATAILLVVYPDRYGVWNSTSEAGMKITGLWPQFKKGTTPGQRYARINEILCQLATSLKIDLWTLDWLWWELVQEQETEGVSKERSLPPWPDEQRFRLEQHLLDFLVANWEHTELGKEWDIYSEPGEELAGCEYPTDVGRIDILARHKHRPAWLVVELKRGRTSDQTLGQLLRYMGWVQRNLASPEEEVNGLIIAADVEPALLLALEALGHNRVQVMRYRVQFHLEHVSALKR